MGVTRGSCLGVDEAPLGDLGDVQVAELVVAFGEEDVGALEVAVEDLLVVEGFESEGDVDDGAPDLLLLEVGLVGAVSFDLLLQVSSLGVLHDDVEDAVV